jgi:hypothetical protein
MKKMAPNIAMATAMFEMFERVKMELFQSLRGNPGSSA